MDTLKFGEMVFQQVPLMWTCLLLITRFSIMIALLPGIGMGASGRAIRMPAILIFAFVSVATTPQAAMPSDFAVMAMQVTSEVLLGSALAFVPAILIAGVQLGGQLASTSMGLNMGNMIDPTFGNQASDLSRVMGDLTVIAFLIVGGHHVVLYAVAGLGGTIVPGTFILGEKTLGLFIDRTSDIFVTGMLIASPVVVSLLLTNIVMGLISKAIPTVNIFIISFPLTIGIGLVLMVLSLPEIVRVVDTQMTGLETSLQVILDEAKSVPAQPDGA